jgi:SAM-dependent methyltransferase
MTGMNTTDQMVQIEEGIRAHPCVREVAVVKDGSNAIWIFAVPNDQYMDDILGRSITGSAVVEKWRKAYDLSQLSKQAISAPVGFNTIGWNSSYTRGPIAHAEVQEWVEVTVADIRRLQPKSVYEVGCGTGMLLMRIAPDCDRYVAADFSPAVLARLNEQLMTIPALQGRVQTMERRADNFSGLNQDSFDTVILSSVVQYFPSATYLTEVLGNAVKIVRPGGHVYVGDVRSLPLISAFAASVELYQAPDEMRIEQLRDRIRRRLKRDPELVLSPAFFLDLQSRFPKISRVEIRPLRGYARNEMSQYRFQAIIYVGYDRIRPSSVEFLDWEECRWGLKEICATLRQHPNKAIGIKRIRNARIERDIESLARIEARCASSTVGELRRSLSAFEEAGIDPQALFDLSNEGLGFTVSLSWASGRPDGTYDALLVPDGSDLQAATQAASWPQPESIDRVRVASAPGQSSVRDDLINQLRILCVETQSKEMDSAKIVLVDTLVRTPDGNVDSIALLVASGASCWS